LHAAEKAIVHRRFDALEGLEVVSLPAGREVPAALERYRRSGLVAFAEPDYWARVALTPNDPAFADGWLWHLHNVGQKGGRADADIDAPEGWETLISASNIIIAIVDTGVRYTHEDLAANLWVNPGEIPRNGLDDDRNGYVDDVHGINAVTASGDPSDGYGHGTQVAGLAGALGHNGVGTAGVAWRVKLMACRWSNDAGEGSISDIVQCIEYARAKGAHIINASFVVTNETAALLTAISACRRAGVIVVAAAGNDATDNDVRPSYPASYSLDNVVAVCATTRRDDLAEFSNFGATSLDLGAPGLDVYSTLHEHDQAYVVNGGTSFAAPIVSGALALLKARFPQMTYREWIERLLGTVDPLPALQGKCATGGRLNLARALGPSVAAEFTASPSAGRVPLTVDFRDSSFGTITNWAWDFGDGAASDAQHPRHTYHLPGPYRAELTVQASNGVVGTTNRVVNALLGYSLTNAAFGWVDPSGLPVLSLGNDAVSPAQALPFAFNFFGLPRTQLYVGANGLLGFSSNSLSSGANTDLPSPAEPNEIMGPFWDDLNPALAGSVRIGTVGAAPHRKLVVAWVGVRYNNAQAQDFTFEVLLEEGTDEIVFQYLDVLGQSASRGQTATIGLESVEGALAARHSFNGSRLLSNNTALRFTPEPRAGILAVAPSHGFASGGLAGGPFDPVEQRYLLTNTGGSSLTWALEKRAAWLSAPHPGGTLNVGEAAFVPVSLNDQVNLLPGGRHQDVLSFTNVSTGLGSTTRDVVVLVEVTPSLAWSPGPAATLRLQGTPGRRYVIESSTNLIQWLGVFTNSADASGRLLISDLPGGLGPTRFYRARAVP
jgi:subtilisin family serine protease